MPEQILTDVQLPDFRDRPPKAGDILRTAERLFMQFGYKRVTVEEICREAGVSKVTFYKYFANKSAVLEEYLNARIELSWKTFDRIRFAQADLQQKLKALIAMKESALSQFSAVFYRSLLEGDANIQALMARWQTMTLDAMKQFFADAQAAGEISVEYNLDFLLHVFMILSTDAQSEVVQRIYGDDLLHLSKDFMNFLFFGISGPDQESET